MIYNQIVLMNKNYWNIVYDRVINTLDKNEVIIKKVNENDDYIYNKYYDVTYLSNKKNLIYGNINGKCVKYKILSKL